jgi:hypothetical protein
LTLKYEEPFRNYEWEKFMAKDDPKALVVDLMDQLNKALPELRKQWSVVIGLKTEIAAHNVSIKDPNFTRLVERYLDAW